MLDQSLYYILLVGCLLLGASLVIAAWRRPDTRRRGARLLAGLLAAVGLWLTAYPPHRAVSVPQAEAILLTNDYQPDTLRAMLTRYGAGTRVWRYASEVVTQAPSDTPTVASLTTLREQMPSLRRLHVLGRGLPVAVLPALGPVRLVSHTQPGFTGFQAAHWNRELELGQPLLVEGHFASATRQPGAVWVRLQAAGATRDSVRLPAGRGTFKLRYVPRVAGRFVAALSVGPHREPLATEPVPVVVVPPRPLRVLLLAVTPSFELKFLKNHLAARQHSVAWRVGISRGLTQTEFSNQPVADLSRLTPTLLTRFDVVVAEAGVLAALPAVETQTLRTAQRNAGLGLVVLSEAAPLPVAVPGRAAMRVLALRGPASTRAQRLLWPASPAATALVPVALAVGGTARPLVTLAGTGAVVVAGQRIGQGQVVISTLPETYPWLLQNTPAVYESYWSRLLTAATRPTALSARWTLADPWPRPQTPIPLRLTASFPTSLPVVLDAEAQPLGQMPLRQDTGLPEWSTTTFWPTTPGWHQVALRGQPTHWFYVFASQDWQGSENQRRAQGILPWLTSATDKLAVLQRSELWPAGWFFTLFVLAAGFLWLEEKL